MILLIRAILFVVGLYLIVLTFSFAFGLEIKSWWWLSACILISAFFSALDDTLEELDE